MLAGLDIRMAQINPIVGDLRGNLQKHIDVIKQNHDADIIVFPELSLTGYSAEDLNEKPFFLFHVEETINDLQNALKDFAGAIIAGFPKEKDDLHNCVAFMQDNKAPHYIEKSHLPNFSVFDEKRIFKKGTMPDVVDYKGHKIGILICEDFWYSDVALHLKDQGAEILISPNGSPYEIEKHKIRMQIGRDRVQETGLPVMYVNQVGGQDEVVYDGDSFAMNSDGTIMMQAPVFEECVVKSNEIANAPDTYTQIYQALVCGVRDYVNKSGFPGVLIGLSGGIDSALTAAIAVDALGTERVECIMMPSPFTSQESLDDAAELAENLGVAYRTISIEPAMQAFDKIINGLNGVAHENMQSRARGMILMSLSNMSGKMVLTTGNKSEMAVGYATLYGDMCGGYNPLKDVYKTQVFELSRAHGKIPQNIITKAPTAELRHDQRDDDSLPPYDELDAILHLLIEEDLGFDAITAKGHDKTLVKKIWALLDRAEYKRRQSAPGPKISTRAFGRERRYPIINKFLK